MRESVVLLILLFLARLSADAQSPERKPGVDQTEVLFLQHAIPHLRIQLSDESLAALRNKFRLYTRCTVTEGTNIYRDVGIHLKGQYGTFQGIDNRPSLTLNFDKYVRAQRFFGLDKLHLNNSAQDPTYLCEIVGRELMLSPGIPTGRAGHARVQINGRDLGLFVLIEGYDGEFIRSHFKNRDGNLYDSEFRHDITDPLRRSSGDDPSDHADLQTLAAAAREPDGAQRLGELAKLLDLDRFYSMLALESLMRHHDGYAMSVNNYWLYFEPRPGKAVFIPHGMDQIFYEPQAALLPNLEGMLAQAVLQTPTGRHEFQSRCRHWYNKLFPGLSNRVEILRTKIRPTLASIDRSIAEQHDVAVTNLQRRIQERIRYLEMAVLADPQQPRFDQSGVAKLTNWVASVEGGKATFIETNRAGEPVLEVQLRSNETPVIARWQKAVFLQKGSYRLSAKIMADQPVFRGPSLPVFIKIWGMNDLRIETTRPDFRTVEIHVFFESAAETKGEYLIDCEARNKDVSVTYQIGAVQLSLQL